MCKDLGLGPNDVVTYVLPNLPQTHFVLWGAEAAGIANPINPLLEPETIKEICTSAGTKILVALGDMPGTDIWQKIDSIRKEIPSLEHVVRINGPSDPSKNILLTAIHLNVSLIPTTSPPYIIPAAPPAPPS